MPRSTVHSFPTRRSSDLHRVWEHAAVPADVLELARHVALFVAQPEARVLDDVQLAVRIERLAVAAGLVVRSEEHTSELQSPCNLVCLLLLAIKKEIIVLQ